MTKGSVEASVNAGLDVLARAARETSGRTITRGGVVLLTQPIEALAQGSVLIAVADTNGVALKLVDAAAEPTTECLDELARRIAEIEVVAAQIAPSTSRAVAPPALTDQEALVLRSGGLQPGMLEPDERHLLYRATAEYADLLRDSYTVEQAARILGVNGSRIRQRLTSSPRTLYGIKHGRTWRIPRFQFRKGRLVPGVETVVSRLAESLHPVAVYRWFTRPNPDLTVTGEHPVSPLEWLQSGNPPDAVANLAAAL